MLHQSLHDDGNHLDPIFTLAEAYNERFDQANGCMTHVRTLEPCLGHGQMVHMLGTSGSTYLHVLAYRTTTSCPLS